MQYIKFSMSKFWLSEPFYDTGSEGSDGSDTSDAGSDSGEEATDGNASGDASGDTGKTGDVGTQNNDSAQDGEPTYNELLARNVSLTGKVEELGFKYGKQSNVLGDLKKQLKGVPSITDGQQVASQPTGNITMTQEQLNQLLANREADPSGTATDGMATLQQQVTSLAGSMQQVGDHLLHQRMVEKFTPKELEGYVPRVVEMGQQLVSGAISYEEVLNFAVRGENVQQIITEAKQLGEVEYKKKLQDQADASVPSAGTGRQHSSGAPQFKEISADDALKQMRKARAS